MSDSDSIHLAMSVIEGINSIKRSMRSMAESNRSRLSEIDSVIVNTAKKTVLVDGLAGLSVDANVLKAEKDSLQAVNQYILDNVPELTK